MVTQQRPWYRRIFTSSLASSTARSAQAQPAPRSSYPFDALPPDVFLTITQSLFGQDLLALSHANYRLYNELLGPTSVVWTSRVPRAVRDGPFTWDHPVRLAWPSRKRVWHELAATHRARKADVEANAKRHYFVCASVQFPGLAIEIQGTLLKPLNYVAPCDPDMLKQWTRASFSFDAWIALLPNSVAGGVVLGAMSAHGGQFLRPTTSAHFLHVDPIGNLYCSIVSGDSPVLTALAFHQWYHVALSLERSAESTSAEQCVYVNGVLLERRVGSLPSGWSQLEHVRVGTGVMPPGSTIAIDQEYGDTQHYGFCGLVDNVRFWTGVLTPSDVERLVQGDEPPHDATHASRAWSMMDDASPIVSGKMDAVRCARPQERSCQDVRSCFAIEGTMRAVSY